MVESSTLTIKNTSATDSVADQIEATTVMNNNGNKAKALNLDNLLPIRNIANHGAVTVELASCDGQLLIVKRLLATDARLRERLEREAHILRKLNHVNIAAFIDYFENQLIYTYIEGAPLDQHLQYFPGFPTSQQKSEKHTNTDDRKDVHCSEELVNIMKDVLLALTYAHDNGVIHCDIKPSNIIVSSTGKAHLTDFGFAKDLDLGAITSPDLRMGTPHYMSPEQFQGYRNDLRSDIYSVGAVFYHMLVGEPPFSQKLFRVLLAQERVELKKLTGVKSELVALVEKALELEPRKRFQSATEMYDALIAIT